MKHKSIDKLKSSLLELESKLYDEKIKESRLWNNKGFGYAQRHGKLGNAFTKRGERLRNQIAELKKQISETDTNIETIDYNKIAAEAWVKQFGTEYKITL